MEILLLSISQTLDSLNDKRIVDAHSVVLMTPTSLQNFMPIGHPKPLISGPQIQWSYINNNSQSNGPSQNKLIWIFLIVN